MGEHLYLFLGDAWRRERAIQALRRKLLGETPQPEPQPQPEPRVLPLDGEDFRVEALVRALGTASLFEESVWIHVRRVEKLPDAAVKALLPHLAKPLPPGRYLVFEGEKLDKRGALYKLFAERGHVEELPAPTRRELPGFVQQMLRELGVKLPSAGVRFLLENVEGDLARFAREIEKLALYARGRGRGRPLSLEEVQALIFADKGANVFAALDALLAREPRSIGLLKAALEGGEEPTKVFYLLAAQVRRLLAVKSLAEEGLSAEAIARRTGEFPWLVKRRLGLVRRLSTQELVDLLHALHEEDVRMKRGERRPDDALWAAAWAWVFGREVRTSGEGPKPSAWGA